MSPTSKSMQTQNFCYKPFCIKSIFRVKTLSTDGIQVFRLTFLAFFNTNLETNKLFYMPPSQVPTLNMLLVPNRNKIETTVLTYSLAETGYQYLVSE